MNSWTRLWVDSSLANLQGPAVTILNQKARFLMVDGQLTAKCTLMNFNCCLVRSLEFDAPFHYVYFPYCNWEHGRTWLELRIRCEHNFGIVVIFMHALCYFFLSLQLIQAVLSTSFHQLGPGKKDTKKVVAKLFLFLFIIIYFTKLKSIKKDIWKKCRNIKKKITHYSITQNKLRLEFFGGTFSCLCDLCLYSHLSHTHLIG